MNTYKRHRFPPDIISYAVWLYYRFNLSHRDVEDLLAERGITVSYEAIRLWCIKFGALYARRLKQNHRGYGDTFYIDEVFLKINGRQYYLWWAVDQDGEDRRSIPAGQEGWRSSKAILQASSMIQRWRTQEDRHGQVTQLSSSTSGSDPWDDPFYRAV